ncbi:MAG: NAD(P)/FAD-dependent oxidoreductase [Desulfobacterales bacterium]|nr:NAD(P)/FAD-dependent oxidoreductase [Desulfobacterales bacterium]
MANEIEIAIIGGGVVGCAVAWELSGHYNDVFLFEKNPGVTKGENQSSRNSGVIHSGIYYDQETRSQKAAMCVTGNRLLYDFCGRYEVPALKTGKLVVAVSKKEEDILDLYLDRAGKNLVPGVKKIPGSEVRELEPNVIALSALFVPTTGIVEPTALVYRFHALASLAGVQFMTDTEVVGLEAEGDFIRLVIRYRDGHMDRVKARVVVNAAGVEADRMARLINPDSPYELDPVRGESYKFYAHKRPELGLSGMNVYPAPEAVITPNGSHFTVGVHLTPTFGDSSARPASGSTVTVGPGLVPVSDRDEWSGPPSSAKIFAERVNPFFPGLKKEDLMWHQAGMQSRLKGYPDFVIEADSVNPRFINLLGIDSPGLTSSLAISRRVGEMVEGLAV